MLLIFCDYNTSLCYKVFKNYTMMNKISVKLTFAMVLWSIMQVNAITLNETDATLRYYDPMAEIFRSHPAKITVTEKEYIISCFSDRYDRAVFKGTIYRDHTGKYFVEFNHKQIVNGIWGYAKDTYINSITYKMWYTSNYSHSYSWNEYFISPWNRDFPVIFEYDPDTGNLWNPNGVIILAFKDSVGEWMYSNDWKQTISEFEEVYCSISVTPDKFKDDIPSVPAVEVDVQRYSVIFNVTAVKEDLNGNELTSGPYVLELYAYGKLLNSYNVNWDKFYFYDRCVNNVQLGEHHIERCVINVRIDQDYIDSPVYARLIDKNPNANINEVVYDNKYIDETIYDITGRIVTEPILTPGMYIKSGKKFLVD